VVFNVDKTAELASFGKSLETVMFKENMIRKALNGTLTEGIISFDEKPMILYWIGNRESTVFGDNPTAEVDFSKNPGIVELKINGKIMNTFIGQVDIYKNAGNIINTRFNALFNAEKNQNDTDKKASNKIQSSNEQSQIKSEKKVVSKSNISAEKSSNEFYMKLANGKTFKGYIRNIEDNATTAFVKIPCTIPQSLIDAAVNGTIAKLNIYSDGTEKENIAEVVFGLSQ
jgi:hypothetical protein